MNHRPDPVVIVCSADGPYARPLAVTLVSLVAHLDRGRPLAIHIIDRGIPEAEKDLLVRSLGAGAVTVSWHHPDRRTLVGVPLYACKRWMGITLPGALPVTPWSSSPW